RVGVLIAVTGVEHDDACRRRARADHHRERAWRDQLRSRLLVLQVDAGLAQLHISARSDGAVTCSGSMTAEVNDRRHELEQVARHLVHGHCTLAVEVELAAVRSDTELALDRGALLFQGEPRSVLGVRIEVYDAAPGGGHIALMTARHTHSLA